jgi:hypothetical protein
VIEPDAELAAEAAGSDDEQASSTEPAYSEAA